MNIKLPSKNGSYNYQIIGTEVKTIPANFNRIVFSAAHVVANPLGGQVDWKSTLKYRHHLWSLGFGIAEAMDTAQRGMGLTWKDSLKLIEESVKQSDGQLIFNGVGTDHLGMIVQV